MQVGAYVGLPAAIEGFRAAEKVIEDWNKTEGKFNAKL